MRILSKQIVSSNVVLDALRSKGNTALPQLVVANIDQTKRMKERKKLGADQWIITKKTDTPRHLTDKCCIYRFA